MSGSAVDSCAVAQHQISLEIDHALSASDARELEVHLASCVACQRFRRQVRELSDRVADLPIRLGTRDLAHRARSIAAKRSGAQRILAAARWQRAAAILIGALSVWNAYGIVTRSLDRFGAGSNAIEPNPLGRDLALAPITTAPVVDPSRAEPSTIRDRRVAPREEKLEAPRAAESIPEPSVAIEEIAPADAGVPVDDVASIEYRAANEPAPQDIPEAMPVVAAAKPLHPYIARAGRAVLSDLAVLDEIPEAQRAPLIGAQMKRFGLTDWVARERANKDSSPLENDLALVLMRVQDALDSPHPEVALDGLRADPGMGEVFATLRSIGPVAETSSEIRPDPKAVVADVAGRLGAAERTKLEELLQFKEAWIEGMYGPAVRAATGAGEDGAKLASEPFGAAMRVAVVSALTEAGGRQPSASGKAKGSKRTFKDESIHVPFLPIEFMHLENARFDVGKDGESLSIRVDYGGKKH